MKIEQRLDVEAFEVADMEAEGHRSTPNFERKALEA
jgi:hypothetical protein